MPNPDAIANVIVFVAAAVGAILAAWCVTQILRHRGRGNDASGLTYRQGG